MFCETASFSSTGTVMWLDVKACALDTYKNLLDSCLRILRCLQFESATLRGPLVSDASQLLPLIWHYAYRPKPYRFWQLLLVYQHIHHRTGRPRVLPYIAKKDSAHRCRWDASDTN